MRLSRTVWTQLAILAVVTAVVWPLLKGVFYLFTSHALARHRGARGLLAVTP